MQYQHVNMDLTFAPKFYYINMGILVAINVSVHYNFQLTRDLIPYWITSYLKSLSYKDLDSQYVLCSNCSQQVLSTLANNRKSGQC